MATNVADLARALIDAWNTHDPDRIFALFADDFVYEDVTFGAVTHGREETRQFFAGTFAAFPDLHFEQASDFAVGEHGAAEWTMTGTHDGDFPGLPATHKSFTVRGASVFDLAGDKIRYNRDYWDFATLLRQIGLLPEPATA